MATNALYILYNADSSFRGKLKYGYRKLVKSSDDNPACAACDLTHGGLSLHETPAWKDVKKMIESELGVQVVQWHRDEISCGIRQFLIEKNLRFPCVVATKPGGTLELVMDHTELATFKGDAQKMLEGLREKGIRPFPQAAL